MPKLQEYSASAICTRTAVGECNWPLERIVKYLEKHNEKSVDALWIAKQRDVKRSDKLWILICRMNDPHCINVTSQPKANGLAPAYIKKRIREFICTEEDEEDIDNNWLEVAVDSKNILKRAMKLIVKLLEEHEKK